LFQIYHGICVPISIQIKKDMIKLLQKNGAVFYASQSSTTNKDSTVTFKCQKRSAKHAKSDSKTTT